MLAEDGGQRDAARPAGIDEQLAEGLEPAAVAVYPPVVEYSAEFRARAAD